jgi:hypothetical protein
VKRLAVLLLFALFASCSNSPTDPLEDLMRGRLAGIVTIGPNCPVETPGSPCPTPPSAYSLRKIQVYNATRTNLLHTVDISSQGSYLIDLPVGDYVVDVQKSGIDRVDGVPRPVTITKNGVTTVNISIDTGIR